MLKIYSKFQDYYDSAIGSFVDSDVVINRKQETLHIPYRETSSLGDFRPEWHENSYSGFYKMVGVCGKWYFLKRHVNLKTGTIDHEYHTFDEIVDPAKNSTLYKWFHPRFEKKDPNKETWWNTDIFEKYGPVLMIDKYNNPSKYCLGSPEPMELQVYPVLKDLKFTMVMDPYTVLWELEHWYDTHARPDDAIVPVGDDVTRLQAYGFDKKTSFRKAKKDA